MLATLGYGDAIGHEVLGIQRVLRARLRVRDLRRDRRPAARAPDDRLSRDGRRDRARRTSSSITSRSGRARRAPPIALPGRMALVYHNITPPEYFLGVHKDLVRLCFRGRRELTAYARAASWRWATRNTTGRSSRTSVSARPAVLPVVPDFSHLDGAPEPIDRRAVRRWVDEHSLCRARHPEQEVRGSDPRFHVYRTRHQPRARLLLVGSYSGFEKYLAMLHAARRRARHAGCALPRPRHQRGADRPLRRRGSVPVRERARGFLRAAGRGFTSASRSWRTRPPRCRRRWTAAACCTTTRIPSRWRG